MAPLSHGRFDEFHDKDQIIEIGSVKFDKKTNKIPIFLPNIFTNYNRF